MKEVLNTVSIKVEDDTDYYLSIVIGDGNKGQSAFKNYDGKWVIGDVANKKLGDGNIMKKSPLILTTTITRLNSSTKHVSVTYQLNENNVKSYEDEVDTVNESIRFITTMNFIQSLPTEVR